MAKTGENIYPKYSTLQYIYKGRKIHIFNPFYFCGVLFVNFLLQFCCAKQTRMKPRKHTPVRLRRRKLPSGNTTLYLDIYEGGERRCEHLRLYLIPERDKRDKAANRETMRLAEDIAARRLADILEFKRTGRNTARIPFGEFYGMMTDERKGNTRLVWNVAAGILSEWIGWRKYIGDITPSDVGELARLIEFADLAPNTKRNYFSKASCVMRTALKRGLVSSDPFAAVDRPKGEHAERTHLTMEELRRMAETPCRNGELKRAFMASALTGLRKSDLKKLQWSEITTDMSRIVFRQKKTGGQEYLDLSPSAAEWLGERGAGMVFDFTHIGDHSEPLRRWARDAGVDKPITFHTARHTFACMMLELDVDIYTLSKLLGHANIATTQIYAKVVDKKKREAVGKIPFFSKKHDFAPKK